MSLGRGKTKIETVHWCTGALFDILKRLTQAQMAELFQKDQSVIARHINNALKEGELEENSNMHFLHNTQYKYRPTKIYDLDTIICVG